MDSTNIWRDFKNFDQKFIRSEFGTKSSDILQNRAIYRLVMESCLDLNHFTLIN